VTTVLSFDLGSLQSAPQTLPRLLPQNTSLRCLQTRHTIGPRPGTKPCSSDAASPVFSQASGMHTARHWGIALSIDVNARMGEETQSGLPQQMTETRMRWMDQGASEITDPLLMASCESSLLVYLRTHQPQGSRHFSAGRIKRKAISLGTTSAMPGETGSRAHSRPRKTSLSSGRGQRSRRHTDTSHARIGYARVLPCLRNSFT